MSDEEDNEESWSEFFESNRPIPVHLSKLKSEGAKVFHFCLTLKSLELAFQSQNEAVFQLRITFYDAANQCFFGNTWISSDIKLSLSENAMHTIRIDEPLYFSSSVNEFTTMAVLELINTSTAILTLIGWSWIRIFSQYESLTDTDETARAQERRIDFFNGTPAALLHMTEPIEEFPQLTKRGHCALLYTLQTHEALNKVLHLIPENIVVSGDDIIPGVSESTEEDSDTIDILRFPVPSRTWPLHLNKLSIDLLPSVEKFEELLCKMINEDRLLKDGLQPDGAVVSIAERKLKVGVHNGWKFVKPPHIVYLERSYSDSSSSKKSSMTPGSGMSSSTKKCVGLVLNSRLELDEMVHHHLFAIVFQLLYVVNVPVSQPEIPTGKLARSKLGSSFGSIPLAKKIDLVIRSIIWTPFENGKIDNGHVSLELEGCTEKSNPFGSLVFTEIYDFPEDLHFDSLGKINFTLYQTRLKKTFGPNQQNGLQSPTLQNYSYMKGPSSGDDTLNQLDTSQLASLSSRQPLPNGGLTSEQYMQQQQLLLLQQQQQEQQKLQITSLSPTQAYVAQHLTELPKSQLYTPLIVSSMETPKPVPMSRVAHSLLYTVPYPQIVDTQGNHPFIVDPSETIKYELARENRDPLHANEIVLQFLAVNGCAHQTVFFTFQFYRFPQTTTERLLLKEVDGTEKLQGDIPYVLQKSTRDGKISKHSPPGLMINYTVDPAFLQPGEKTSFLKYLLQQRLYIDMWDGDSLMLIGSTSIELKHLLRQGQSAVQVSQELDIVFVEYGENDALLAGDAIQRGLPHHAGVTISLEGKLFMRVANIGCLPDTNSEKVKEIPKSFHSTVVEPNSLMLLNGKSSNSQQYRSALKTTAKLMSDVDSELATVLLTRKDGLGKTKIMKENDVNAVRKRKMDRMLAVRNMQEGENTSPFILQKEEKMQRTRDLKTIQLYRERYKSNNIISKLEESITTHHMLHSSLGRAEFFEYKLKNPYPKDMPVTITFSDTELSVITNPKEWKFYKTLMDINTGMEEEMFSAVTDEDVKIFLRGKEVVHVPFRFQSFTSQHLTPEMDNKLNIIGALFEQNHQHDIDDLKMDSTRHGYGPIHPLHLKSQNHSLQTFGKDTSLSSKDIKVTFRGVDNKPISILIVHVEMHPHTINQTFRFFHPEQTFLKKAIRLPPLHTLPGASVHSGNAIRVVARCSDDGAVCETHRVQAGEPQDIFIKVPCGLSPLINRFFVIVFIDEYCSQPCQIWQFYVHSLQRIDISATEGQTSTLSVVLKGTKTSRMVKCFSSHPEELKTAPANQFMLMANGVQELTVSLNPRESGKRMMFLNVVDQEFHQLVKSWLLMSTCTPPVITKAFEVNLKVGGGIGSNKKISFVNPYPIKKNFYFKTNRVDLVTFKEEGILLGGGESHNIGLYFLPQQLQGSATIYIFINDRDGKNEEAFCIKVNYYSDRR